VGVGERGGGGGGGGGGVGALSVWPCSACIQGQVTAGDTLLPASHLLTGCVG
jgi:hypothetical protein